jgi:enterochelin esterase-like enzyme
MAKSVNNLTEATLLPNLKCFSVKHLLHESVALKGNPLKDEHKRRIPILIPNNKTPKEGWPVVFVLSGFFGNGPNAFNIKTFEENTPEVIDSCVHKNEGAKAIYVFVDAMTFWGGSQFVNSSAVGSYEDYIIELTKAVKESLPVNTQPERWCVTGTSSGGYGALHLGSKYPKVFGYVAALAPDSFFEASLLPELRVAATSILRFGGVKKTIEAHKNGELVALKNWHVVLNAMAMSACYSPAKKPGEIDYPIDIKTGEIQKELWKNVLKHDPIVFLAKRQKNLSQLKRVFLSVGNRDQYMLHFGARQIRKILIEQKVAHDYTEFDGNHFDCGPQRPRVWAWLKKHWGGQ